MHTYRHIDDEVVQAVHVSEASLTEAIRLLADRAADGDSSFRDVMVRSGSIAEVVEEHRGEWLVRDSAGNLYAMGDRTFRTSYLRVGTYA